MAKQRPNHQVQLRGPAVFQLILCLYFVAFGHPVTVWGSDGQTVKYLKILGTYLRIFSFKCSKIVELSYNKIRLLLVQDLSKANIYEKKGMNHRLIHSPH